MVVTPDDPSLAATIDSDGNQVVIPGLISGDGGLTATNTNSAGASGSLELSNRGNNFSGVTIVAAGDETLVLGSPTALQQSTFDTSGPGCLNFNGFANVIFGGLQGDGNMTLAPGVSLQVGGNGFTTTLSGSLLGSGTLNVVGPGGLILAADNSNFTGTTTVGAWATLEAAFPAALPAALPGYTSSSGSLTVSPEATLAVAPEPVGGWNQAQIDALTGSGCLAAGANLGLDTQGNIVGYDDTMLGPSFPLVVFGGGTLALTGTNPNLLGLTVQDATVQVDSASPLDNGSAPITLDGGTLQAGNALSLSASIILGQDGGTIDTAGNTVTLTGSIYGSGLLSVIDSTDSCGTLVADGCDWSAGGTDIEEATVQLGNNYALGSGDPLTVNGGTLDLNGNLVQAASLSGNNVTIIDSNGGGILQLESDSTVGNLSLNAGRIDLNGNSLTVASLAGGTLAGGGGTITNSDSGSTSTLYVDQAADTTYFGNIADGGGTVAVNVAGGGMLVDAGDNTCSGGTTIANGALAVTTASGVPDAALIIGAGGTLIFDPAQPLPPQTQQTLPAMFGQGASAGTGDGGGAATSPNAAPTVTAIQCVGPSLVDANSVIFHVSFSEPVMDVAAGDFTVDGPGSVAAVSGGIDQYTVTVSVAPGAAGSVGLELPAGGTIRDWFGTPLVDAAAAPVDQQYTVSRQLYWDASGGDGPAGGSGTWGPGDENWRVGSPTGPLQGWVDGSDAFFAGTPGTIQVASPVVADSITFLAGGYTLQGAAISLVPSAIQPSMPLSEGEGSTIDVAVGSATIDCEVAGDFAKTDSGTLVLAGGSDPATSITVAAGTLDLDGTTAAASAATLLGGRITNGTLDVGDAVNLYGGTVSADITGPAALEKLGPGTALLTGDNSYTGGSAALDGTLIAASASSLPDAAVGPGTVVVQPTLYWSGSGDWTTGQWQLADGTPTPWIDGSGVVIAARSALNINGTVNVSAVTVQGDAAISGGTITLPASGTTIGVLSGAATISSAIAGGGFAETGPGTLVIEGAVSPSVAITVDQGTLDALAPLASPPLAVGGQAIGPGAVFGGGQSLDQVDPAMFGLVQSLFGDQSIDRTDMIQILDSAAAGGAVSPADFAALQMLAMPQNEAALNVPGYVAVLAGDVINGNPANAAYQGQPLGNMAGQGSPQAMATALNELVGKWFFGTDLPATAPGTSYSVVAGPLYGDNPDPAQDVPTSKDMAQGGMGDCYLIAALGAIADSFTGGHREHDHRQRRGKWHPELDGAVLLPGRRGGLRARLRDRQRPLAGRRQRKRGLCPTGCRRQLVAADPGEGLCPVERDRPGGPRRPEQLCQPLLRLDAGRGRPGVGHGGHDVLVDQPAGPADGDRRVGRRCRGNSGDGFQRQRRALEPVGLGRRPRLRGRLRRRPGQSRFRRVSTGESLGMVRARGVDVERIVRVLRVPGGGRWNVGRRRADIVGSRREFAGRRPFGLRCSCVRPVGGCFAAVHAGCSRAGRYRG